MSRKLTVKVPRGVIILGVLRWVIGHFGGRARSIDRSAGVDLRAIGPDTVSRQQLEEARRERLAALTLARSWSSGRSLAKPVVWVGADCDHVPSGKGVAGRLRGIARVGRCGGRIVNLCCDVVFIACYPVVEIAGHIECEPAGPSQAGRYIVTVDMVGLVGRR